jgi:ABC-type transport system involved in multi-copper enzyme maturation permease subunit
MGGSFSAELFKLRKRPATWVLAIIWLGLGLIFGYIVPYIIYLVGKGNPAAIGGIPPQAVLASALPDEFVSTVLSGFPLFVGAIVLILGAISVGSEYGWNTLKTVLGQRPRRLSVFGGKLLALALVIFILVLATFAIGVIASWIIAQLQHQPIAWPSALHIVKGFGASMLIASMWCAFGVFLAFLFRGTALAIGLGLIWALVIESLISGFAFLLEFFKTVQKGLPGINAGSLATALGATPVGGGPQGAGTPGVSAIVGGTQAMIVLFAYIAFFVIIAAIVLQRRDVA